MDITSSLRDMGTSERVIRICSKCNNEYNCKKTKRGRICFRCTNAKYPVSASYQKKWRDGRKALEEELISKKECFKWIELCYKRRLMIDFYGISQLILVYESLGGLTSKLDDLKSGEQLRQMWLHCDKLYKKNLYK